MDVEDSDLPNASDSLRSIKNIRFTSDEIEMECNTVKVKGPVLKTCFLTKA